MKCIPQLLLASAFVTSPAHADIIIDWTGTCRPLSCQRAWGEFRLDDSYRLGTEISEAGPHEFPHSPKLKSFSLHFDYGWGIDTFAKERPHEARYLLVGMIPESGVPLPDGARFLLWPPDMGGGDYFFTADHVTSTWGGPFASKLFAAGMDWDWPTGTDSVFTIRASQVPEPPVLLLLSLLIAVPYITHHKENLK
jgi:hypothetical protein